MAQSGVKIKGLDELLADMKESARVDFIQKHLVAAGDNIVRIAGEYPQAPPEPSAGSFYLRGYGQKWKRADGSEGGKATSEDLINKWKVSPRGKGVQIGNRASYSGYVHGEANDQTQVHKRRGWLSLLAVTKDYLPKLEKIVADRLARKLAGKG